jgi:hypothetical protein
MILYVHICMCVYRKAKRGISNFSRQNNFLICMCITANLIIIDARYRDFNGFPVVNWY